MYKKMCTKDVLVNILASCHVTPVYGSSIHVCMYYPLELVHVSVCGCTCSFMYVSYVAIVEGCTLEFGMATSFVCVQKFLFFLRLA